MLTEIKNRGVEDVCITVWALAVAQLCIVPLIHNTFRYPARQYWDELSRDLRSVFTAPAEAAAKGRFVEFPGKWGEQYPAIIRLWENAWSEFVPFLDYDVEIRRVICSITPSNPSAPATRRAVRPEAISPPSRRP